MEDVLYLKFQQHGDLRTLLLGTFPADLVYAESEDSFWGDGAGVGMNELGKTLVRVRERLRHSCGLPLLSGVLVHYPHTNLQLIIRIRVCQTWRSMEIHLACPSLAVPTAQRTHHRQPILRLRKLSNRLLHP